MVDYFNFFIKRSIILFFLYFTYSTAHAQIEGYSFSVGGESIAPTPNYSFGELGEPWKIFINEQTAVNKDSVTGTGYELGFPFYFSGNYFDRIAFSNNGYIKLGTSQAPFSIPTSFDQVFSSNTSSLYNNIIAHARITNNYLPEVKNILVSLFGFPGERTSVFVFAYQNLTSRRGMSSQLILFEKDHSFRLGYIQHKGGLLHQIEKLTVGLRGNSAGNISLLNIQEGVNTWADPEIVNDFNAVCEVKENIFVAPKGELTDWWIYNFEAPKGIVPPCSKPFYLITYEGFPDAQSTRLLDDSDFIGYYNLLDGFSKAPTSNLTVAWAAASEKDHNYDILLSVTGQAPDTLARNLTDKKINLPQLLPSTNYTIERIAKDSQGNVLYSCQASFTTQRYPDYCQPSPLEGGKEKISFLRFNEIEYYRNSEEEELILLPEENYTTTLKGGETYNFSLKNQIANDNNNRYNVWLYIDLNRDNQWTNKEKFQIGIASKSQRSIENTVQIPKNIIPGKTRIRIKFTDIASTNPGANEACGSSSRLGNRQDYIITLEASESCNGLAVTPSAQNLSCINANNGSISLITTGGTG
ncbi:GEVED domain-containing protein, partial [Fulvivirga sediminis]